MASTVDKSASYEFNSYAKGNMLSLFDMEIDFSATGNSLAQNETMSLTVLPAGVIVLGAEIKVVTAQSDVTDIDLGMHTSGSTDASLIDGVSAATTGYVFTAGIAAAIPVTADTYLVLTNKDAQTLATAKIRVKVLVYDAR